MFGGGVIMVHFNLPSVRGFAMSIVPTPAHHRGNHIRSGSPIRCGFNPTKHKSRSDFPQYCNGCEGRDKCAFTESMAKNMNFRTVTSSETLKHFDFAWFHKLLGKVSWCLVGCDASDVGGKKQDLIQYIKHLAKCICTEIPAASFFFYTADCLLKTISVYCLFLHACLHSDARIVKYDISVCLCLLHVKGQWWRDDSTTTQYHHVVPPNRAEAWRRIHRQPGGLERPRQEPACYRNRYHTYAFHSFMHFSDFYSKGFAVHKLYA